MAKITAEHLKGLKFQTSRVVEVEEDGKKVKKSYPDQIDMLPEHVLSTREEGDRLIIVSADGRKHRVPKNGGEPAGKKSGEPAGKK